MSNRATYDVSETRCPECDAVYEPERHQTQCKKCQDKELTMNDILDELNKSTGSVLKEAYETGYSYGSRETREEIIAKIEKRRKDIENLERDTTELVILLTILKSDRI